MGDNARYGNAVDYDVDLHSVYAAYLGQFESAGTEWWDRSWGGYFGTFNDFLSFGWDVMIVVDSVTGRAHIAVRRDQIGLFAKMIRTRFGETLSKDPPTTLPLSPVPTRTLSLRRLITLSDLAAYRKLALSLPAAELSNLRTRARAGDVGLAEQLFYAGGEAGEREKGNVGVRDNGMGYTWACVKTTWWEKGGAPGGIVPGQGRVNGGREGAQLTGPQGTNGAGGLAGGGSGHKGKSGGLVLEVGMAVLRCAHLRGVDVWPPVPGENYRKSHYIIEEWVDKRTNTNPPSYPRAYAFGKSQWIPEKSLERILDANLGALSSQENDSFPNTLVLLCIGEPAPVSLPTWTTLPNNIIHLDVLALEYNLLRRAQEANIPGTPDRSSPLPSLAALLQTLQIPVPPFVPLGNAGNEAYYTLLAFQKLMMAETRLPDVLFSQPDYGMMMNSPSYVGLNGMGSMTNLSMVGAGMGNYFPNSNSMRFGTPYQHHSQDFGLPPPQAPFANTTHSRSRSGSSNRRSTSTGEMLPPGLPASYSHGGAGTGNGSGSGSGSRNGSPVGGYSPMDSPRRNGGGLPFAGSSTNLRRGSETVLTNSRSQGHGQGTTRSRPTSVPHRSSFEIPSQPSSGSVERDRSMPPKSALRGSSTNIANGGYSNGSPGVGARTVSWSGPPPEVESHDVVSSNSRGNNGNSNGQALSSSAGAAPANGYVNGYGNTYSPNMMASRSPPMMAATRSRSSDYFHSSSMKNVNENDNQPHVDLAEEVDGMQLNPTSKRNSRMSLSSGRRMSSYHLEQGGMATQGSSGMGSNVESGSGIGNGISSQANASTSTASILSGIRPSSTHQSSMSRQGMANRADSGSGNGSTGTGSASGSGIPSVPSLPSGGSLSRTDLAYSANAQNHPQGQGQGTLNGKAKERMMSRSNLSSMVNGNGNAASRVDVSDKLGDGKGSVRKKDKDAKNKSKEKDKEGKKEKEKEKEGKGMKNVAGALARFWVG